MFYASNTIMDRYTCAKAEQSNHSWRRIFYTKRSFYGFLDFQGPRRLALVISSLLDLHTLITCL